ncbi:LacI family DNA-binding transcriptional regulator [Sphingomonas sp. BK580]|uniref:LacI family DNA-binding transcriptional regulator n=1 Tax=Sphingomonas sp. BK580 TaxID=2586972 RepID=UPI00160A2145|nr:LacI family DNA-binding transcriptional regulator [Sphingomonas sp. BK580]MBB3691617.1 LacI family transcriptional regulator [Sphingomonas sp. BK580]
MPNATIRDVAREAQVSVASVSRALNGHERVRPELRARVQAVAARLGYVPHAGARSLSLARTSAIGVVLPDLHGEFFSELLRGMDREAAAQQLALLLTVLQDGRGLHTLARLRGQVDGLVVMAPQLGAAELRAQLPAGLPAVFLNCVPGLAGTALRVDNAAGAAAMVDHLVAAGARAIAHVAGPPGNVDAEERRAGAVAAAERAGVALTVIEGDFNEASGAAAAAQVAHGAVRADALFAANDAMAIGALVALKRHGVAVPRQVRVAGFDDIPLARLVTPALTTMRVDIAALGARAVQLLARRIAAPAEGLVEVGPADAAAIVPRLVVRDTTTETDREKQS